jgi:hypothetical protein
MRSMSENRLINVQEKIRRVLRYKTIRGHLRRFTRATPTAEPVSVVLRFCAEALVADRRWAVASVTPLRSSSR